MSFCINRKSIPMRLLSKVNYYQFSVFSGIMDVVCCLFPVETFPILYTPNLQGFHYTSARGYENPIRILCSLTQAPAAFYFHPFAKPLILICYNIFINYFLSPRMYGPLVPAEKRKRNPGAMRANLLTSTPPFVHPQIISSNVFNIHHKIWPFSLLPCFFPPPPLPHPSICG